MLARSAIILVTGGAGFIGSSVGASLLADGARVRVVDAFPEARQHRALAALAGADIVPADLATMSEAALRQLLFGVDRIIHLAGRPGVQPSWGSGFAGYLDHNVAVTQRLLEAAGGRRVVVASSSSVYGDVPTGTAREDRPLRPLSPYGVSKVAVEMLVAAYAARGVDVSALRFFSVYGRRQRPDMAVARLLDAVATGRPFPLRGDGSQMRDMTHVDDVARAVLAATSAGLPPGTVVNVGSGRPVALAEVIDEIETQLDVRVPIEFVDAALGDPARTAADPTRAHDALRWRPEVPLDVGIADQIDAHATLGTAQTTVA